MEIEEYIDTIEEFAKECFSLFPVVIPHKFIENKIESEKEIIDKLISFRKSFVTDKETNAAQALFPLGIFKIYSVKIERIACFTICADLTSNVRKKEWEHKCEKYNISQRLFRNSPELLLFLRKKGNKSVDEELLNIKAFEQVSVSEILKFSNGFTYLEQSLNPIIVDWAKNTFKKAPLFIRANPHYYFEHKPPQRLVESIIIPANPNWWRNLSIHNRMKEGASYLLDECSPTSNHVQWWEKNISLIIRLDVIAKRNNNGNLSMMLEELQFIDDDLLLGRCIHLDTDSPLGTPFENAVLNHLDLAVNLYEGLNVHTRLSENLANGEKTVDANYRTHLLRIEGIPFKGLFGFTESFFKSKTLSHEWMNDQFISQPAR